MNIIEQVIKELYHTPLADLQKLNVALQDELSFRERATITPQDEEYERMAWIANQD